MNLKKFSQSGTWLAIFFLLLPATAFSADDAQSPQELNVAQITNMADCLDYQVFFQTLEENGAPRLYAQHVLRINLDKYQQRAVEIENNLAPLASGKTTMTLDQAQARNAIKILSAKNYAAILDLATIESWYKSGCSGSDSIFLYGRNGGINYACTRDYNIAPDMKITDNLPEYGYFDILQNSAKPMQNNICMVRNASSANCYVIGDLEQKFDSMVENARTPIDFQLQFSVSNGEGFNAINQSSEIMTVRFKRPGFDPWIVSPELYIKAAGELKLVPAIIVWQKIEATPEQIGDPQTLKTSYTLTPVNQ